MIDSLLTTASSHGLSVLTKRTHPTLQTTPNVHARNTRVYFRSSWSASSERWVVFVKTLFRRKSIQIPQVAFVFSSRKRRRLKADTCLVDPAMETPTSVCTDVINIVYTNNTSVMFSPQTVFNDNSLLTGFKCFHD